MGNRGSRAGARGSTEGAEERAGGSAGQGPFLRAGGERAHQRPAPGRPGGKTWAPGRSTLGHTRQRSETPCCRLLSQHGCGTRASWETVISQKQWSHGRGSSRPRGRVQSEATARLLQQHFIYKQQFPLTLFIP